MLNRQHTRLLIFLVLAACSTQQKKVPVPNVPVQAGSVETEASPTPESESTAVPTPTPSEPPKFGIILGPGGLKSFAHIGVLREFEKVGIKPKAIVGLEWGAMLGAFYSVKGLANDTEWQAFKLREEHMPRRGFLKGKIEPSQVKVLDDFLEQSFADKKVEEGDVRFLCPSLAVDSGKINWWGLGLYREAVKHCVPHSPLFEAHDGGVAAAFEIEESAKKLREVGCDVIIFVDVVSKGSILKDGLYRDQQVSQVLWWNGLARLKSEVKTVDWVVGIHSRNYDIGDLAAARSFVVFGQEAGEKAAKMIADKYGM